MTSLLGRYENGEFGTVWDKIRFGQADLADAAGVAVATMQRVAHDVDLIVDALVAGAGAGPIQT